MKTISIQFGPANSLTRSVADNTSVGDLIRNPSYQAALGYGSNVQALDDNRRHLSPECIVSDGMNITLEVVANQKAAGGNITVTLSYGPANSLTREVPAGTTVRDILNNPSYQAALGFGSNVQALIDRIPQGPEVVLTDGDEVQLEVVANQKAL